ncbi:4Fe-4S binding protein [Candidatus Soleaferrea massiliensis]|uniref:4Fe-4S binding protein n=1 Tax=Candidatus Soleaferrea massiliensis TaxID=1470354 RepID=UPI00058CA1E6|nr:4Fe-4S binding protein [Candidatus Soleaferrea massiliensis]
MTAKDCLKILRTVKDAAFATVDGEGRPQVRIIDVMLVEDERLYFCTARGKDFYRQLLDTGWTAVTAMNHNFQMVRLSGQAEQLREQKKWIDRIFEENPVMNEVYPGQSRYILEPFCIEAGQLEFFDLGKTPIYRESFAIGNAPKPVKGFVITEDCIGCGTCLQSCPQACIEAGNPYLIRQEHCLHCGLCVEACPAGAIQRRDV